MATTPLQTLREAGLNAYMRNGNLVVGRWSKMSKSQYDFIGTSAAAIISELNDEAVAEGNTDLCGYKPKHIEAVINNDFVEWPIPEGMRESMGYVEPPEDQLWRDQINRYYGRPLGT